MVFDWAKHTLGISEPIYGPSAIHSVASQASSESTPYRSTTTKEDLAWEVLEGTNVESKTFYMTSEEGVLGLVQVIYSNVLGVKRTAQLSCKVFGKAGESHVWSSDNLHDFRFTEDRLGFVGEKGKVKMELSADGRTYVVQSEVNKDTRVDLTFEQLGPGFVAGKDGTTFFGTDVKKPWGKMKHVFWPRCTVSGSITTPTGLVDFKGRGVFIHALQGMKPHFAAARWNFANFQSPRYSAVMMEFTTPKSYGETVVNVGCVVTDGEVIVAGASPAIKAAHTSVKGDSESGWPEPEAATFTWTGTTQGGREVEAIVDGSLGERTDRVDVMGEVPKFVKQIVHGASGTKPYIYQYTPKTKIRIAMGDEVVEEEEGQLFMEATFIS